jgi:hypothetical protein
MLKADQRNTKAAGIVALNTAGFVNLYVSLDVQIKTINAVGTLLSLNIGIVLLLPQH